MGIVSLRPVQRPVVPIWGITFRNSPGGVSMNLDLGLSTTWPTSMLNAPGGVSMNLELGLSTTWPTSMLNAPGDTNIPSTPIYPITMTAMHL
jgi:hypothetical protein